MNNYSFKKKLIYHTHPYRYLPTAQQHPSNIMMGDGKMPPPRLVIPQTLDWWLFIRFTPGTTQHWTLTRKQKTKWFIQSYSCTFSTACPSRRFRQIKKLERNELVRSSLNNKKHSLWIWSTQTNIFISEEFEHEIGYIQQLLLDTPAIEIVNSTYQDIEIYQSRNFGKVFLLDECLQLTEKDAPHYNEMLAHVPVMEYLARTSTSEPLRILVLGGGDVSKLPCQPIFVGCFYANLVFRDMSFQNYWNMKALKELIILN